MNPHLMLIPIESYNAIRDIWFAPSFLFVGEYGKPVPPKKRRPVHKRKSKRNRK